MILSMTGQGTCSTSCRGDESRLAISASGECHHARIKIDQVILLTAMRIMAGITGRSCEPARHMLAVQIVSVLEACVGCCGAGYIGGVIMTFETNFCIWNHRIITARVDRRVIRFDSSTAIKNV